MRKAVLVAWALGALPAWSASPRISDAILQIGIDRRSPSVTMKVEGKFSVVDQTTGETKRLKSGRPYKVEADEAKRLVLGPFLFLGPARLLPGGPSDYVLIEGKRYRGNMIFKPNPDATVTVVSELGIEEYLYGVLPKEMSPDWPLEALKAQAVVARTFALSNLGKFAGQGFDLSDDSRSQIYSGLEIDSPQVKRAVDETAGEVLHWHGKLMPAYFHSCCGGRTEDPAVVWGMPEGTPKPLRGVGDRYCKISPYYRWSAHFRARDILETLQQHGYNALRLRWIRPGTRVAGSYLKNLRFNLDGKVVSVRANQFRTWMGASDIKSAQIWRIAADGKGYDFVGRGYGHGVGLCQWGARAQAQEGRGYRKILAYYFPGSEIAKDDE